VSDATHAISTVSLPSSFPALCRNWYSKLHFHGWIIPTTEAYLAASRLNLSTTPQTKPSVLKCSAAAEMGDRARAKWAEKLAVAAPPPWGAGSPSDMSPGPRRKSVP